jgi:hypothetical protein
VTPGSSQIYPEVMEFERRHLKGPVKGMFKPTCGAGLPLADKDKIGEMIFLGIAPNCRAYSLSGTLQICD